ncbi:MAG: hypothetical protein PVF69_14545 [Gemmatimonadota bacterium]
MDSLGETITRRNRLWLVLVWVMLVTSPAAGQVPQDTSFSGRLLDGGGAPLVGPATFNLHIFDSDVGGSVLFSEQHAGVALAWDGSFSVLLGSGAPLFGTFDASLFSQVDRYIEVEMISPLADTLAPRVPIASVPWALVAQQANEIVPDPNAPPVTRFMSIPSSAFTSRDASLGWSGNSTGTSRTFSNSQSLLAPVELPHGATVTHFRCGGQDAGADAVLAFTLRRNQPQVANVDMASLSSTPAASGFQFLNTSAIASPDIDNSAFNYYVLATAYQPEVGFPCFGCSVGFCRITYTVSDPYP